MLVIVLLIRVSRRRRICPTFGLFAMWSWRGLAARTRQSALLEAISVIRVIITDLSEATKPLCTFSELLFTLILKTKNTLKYRIIGLTFMMVEKKFALQMNTFYLFSAIDYPFCLKTAHNPTFRLHFLPAWRVLLSRKSNIYLSLLIKSECRPLQMATTAKNRVASPATSGQRDCLVSRPELAQLARNQKLIYQATSGRFWWHKRWW